MQFICFLMGNQEEIIFLINYNEILFELNQNIFIQTKKKLLFND